MKFHHVVTPDGVREDPEVLSSRYGGRRFVTEEQILSWFEGIDSGRPRTCQASGHAELNEVIHDLKGV